MWMKGPIDPQSHVKICFAKEAPQECRATASKECPVQGTFQHSKDCLPKCFKVECLTRVSVFKECPARGAFPGCVRQEHLRRVFYKSITKDPCKVSQQSIFQVLQVWRKDRFRGASLKLSSLHKGVLEKCRAPCLAQVSTGP